MIRFFETKIGINLYFYRSNYKKQRFNTACCNCFVGMPFLIVVDSLRNSSLCLLVFLCKKAVAFVKRSSFVLIGGMLSIWLCHSELNRKAAHVMSKDERGDASLCSE